ncbi:MAG: hypothetical protein ABI457_04770 [Hyphomicrobium sp.]|jgi:hypothetical protein
MTARSTIIYAATMACMLAGCANDGSLSTGLNTGSVNPQAAATQSKSQEALCLTLASQIEALNTEGVSDKVSKAAAKKYKLKATDLTKADELNKANTEFQGKCSSYPPRVAAAVPADAKDTAAAAKETPKVAAVAKAKPPVPSQKPVAAAMATQETTQASSGPVAVGAPE